MALNLDVRSPISVAIVYSGPQRVSGSIHHWLDELGATVTVVGVYPAPNDLLTERVSDGVGRIDLVVVARDAVDDESNVLAVQRICAAGYPVIIFGPSLRDDAIQDYLDAGANAFVAGGGRRRGYAAVTLSTPSALYTSVVGPVDVASPGLTAREAEVLTAWCHAASKEDAADQLLIGRATVSSHLQRIRLKYAAVGRPATTKAALIARAVQDGLVDVYDL
ncbi:LuxR C-terminal-related transcriptional regulator [Mycolicibacterium mucogenicum]|jgi:DNA-binding CsgD family transcriptional regulator|uniref:helix-turn-helix transcriptional regulator n=1 Tax=Mycolicibacterium mucogenicum TaxID=56689 RepID=UPI00226AF53B|nr:LuxR C-terminal-related transcriptional regulator [Mycolicibacterium mucogenicum]MCX8563966.1 LuxR C-terminal-related transcriptional regulator [Mycolicibacterium mucogenicum]